jgi:hypothetical protein
VIGAVLAAAVALGLPGGTTPPATDWLGYGYDAGRSGAAPSTDPVTVLRRAWRVRLRGRITSQVLLAGGTVLAASSGGTVVALDRGGRER